MKTRIALISCLILMNIHSWSQINYEWASNPQNTLPGGFTVNGKDILVDASGNTYVVGTNGGATDFDFGPGVQSLISPGAFLAKYDAAGNFIFVKGIANADAKSMAIDVSGNIYVTGDFNDTADFDPGPGVQNLISNGGED